MFERFTERARRVVVLAQEEARLLDHNYIGTEHLLLGLLHEGEGVAGKALTSLGISLEAVRRQVAEIVGRGERPPSGHIPFTPRVKKVLELSLREANQLGHKYIGTEHILLGLIREGEGVAARVLVALGADLDRTRQQVIRQSHGRPAEGPGEYSRPVPRSDPGGGLDAIRERLDAIAGQLAAIGIRLGIGAEPGREPVPEPGREPVPQPGREPVPEPGREPVPEPGREPEPLPDALRQLDQRVGEVRAQKEAAIDAQDFERAVTLRNEERNLLVRRDAEQRQWLAAAGQRQSGGTGAAELDRLRQVVSNLQAQLRRHGIEPESESESE